MRSVITNMKIFWRKLERETWGRSEREGVNKQKGKKWKKAEEERFKFDVSYFLMQGSRVGSEA
jgi:hypothetical protein